MTGKKKVDRKVLGKKHQRLSPKKLDLKKGKEEVKFMGGLLAELTAVQAELIQSPLNREERRQQLREVNIMVAQLNATVEDRLYGLLDALDKADQDKGH